MASPRYLVTGGAGFIGSNLVEALVGQGHTVRVFDNFSTGHRRNLQPFLRHVDLVEGDVRDFEAVRRAAEGVEVIFHQAALPSVPRSIEDPLTTNEVNVTGTLNVLEAAVQAGATRLVYASSSSVYGDGEALPKHEAMTPRPRSPYAVSKLTGEYYCQVYAQVFGLMTTALRYFNVFGPRQDPASAYAAVIPRFASAMAAGEPVRIYGDGRQSRDFTYVANAVQANLLAATAPQAEGRVLNCACGERTTLLELVDTLAGLMGCEPRVVFDPPRPGDVLHSQADVRQAAAQIGYRPSVGLRQGLQQTLARDYGVPAPQGLSA